MCYMKISKPTVVLRKVLPLYSLSHEFTNSRFLRNSETNHRSPWEIPTNHRPP